MRHLISIPAGIVRMNFVVFSIVTIVGFGDLVHRPRIPRGEGLPQGTATLSDPEAMVHFIKTQSYWIVLIVLALTLLYLATLRLTKPRFEISLGVQKGDTSVAASYILG